jgi:hypothetical protein
MLGAHQAMALVIPFGREGVGESAVQQIPRGHELGHRRIEDYLPIACHYAAG